MKYPRRDVTVLSTDMVGYSRMMAQDPDATVEAVRYYEDTLRRSAETHSGRLFSYAGDGFLVEFSNELAAIQCAYEVQSQLHIRNQQKASGYQIWLRSGIHHGEAIVDKDNLHGDVVNIAVRLQEIAPAGGILVSQTIKTAVEGQFDPRLISIGVMRFKNIPAPLEAFELEPQGEALNEPVEDRLEVDVTAPISGFAGRSAIAVFPLQNASHSSDHDHIPLGFSESLTVALSHMRQFPVISPNSSFALARSNMPLPMAAARLGARYVLSGEFADHREQFRISLRLTDSSTDQVLWSDRYLLAVEDLIPALEEVCQIVAGTLEGQLEQVETVRARASRLSRSSVLDLIWRGRWHLNQLTQKDSKQARDLFEAAVQQDPNDSEALIQLSFWHWLDCWTQRRPRENIQVFHRLAIRARDAKPHDSRGHFLIGAAEILLSRPKDALEHFENSIALNPSHAHAMSQIGSCFMLMGDPVRAIENLEAALRLNSEDYYLFATIGELACSYCMLGDYDRAVALARRSLGIRQSYWHARMTEITALERSGDLRRAAQALDALLVRRPDFFERNYVNWLPFDSDHWRYFFQESLERARTFDRETVT
ncbi:MAG: tetratricopeptide repeat protein [Pseudomonadota bacterium]